MAAYTSTPSVPYCYDGLTFAGADGQCGGSAVAGSIRRLSQVHNLNSTTSYSLYDRLGRVLNSAQQTGGVNYPFGYVYAPAGLTQETFPSGRAVSYGYDQGGRLKSASGYVSGVTYFPHHALKTLTLGNNLAETWDYNDRLQPTSMQA